MRPSDKSKSTKRASKSKKSMKRASKSKKPTKRASKSKKPTKRASKSKKPTKRASVKKMSPKIVEKLTTPSRGGGGMMMGEEEDEDEDDDENGPSSKIVTRRVSKVGSEPLNMLYVCEGADHACVAVENSELLLDFLAQKRYVDAGFGESVFSALQKMVPGVCFLHGITLILNRNGNGNSFAPEFKLNRHAGVPKMSAVVGLNKQMYKEHVIDKCMGGMMAIPLKIETYGLGHQNMLIIDPDEKTCEHFEPHGVGIGGDNADYKDLNKALEGAIINLCKEWFPGYRYIPRTDATNFQAILNIKFEDSIHGGTCNVWSIWYAYMRLSHSHMKRDEILKKSRDLLGQNDFAELENFIIHFLKQLTTLISLKKDGRNYRNTRGRKYTKDKTAEDLLEELEEQYGKIKPLNFKQSYNRETYVKLKDLQQEIFSLLNVKMDQLLKNRPLFSDHLYSAEMDEPLYDCVLGIMYALSRINDQLTIADYVRSAIDKFKHFKNYKSKNTAPRRAVAVAATSILAQNNATQKSCSEAKIQTLRKNIKLQKLSDNDVAQIVTCLSTVVNDKDVLKFFIANFEKDNEMHLGMIYILLQKVWFEYIEIGGSNAYKHATFKDEMYPKILENIIEDKIGRLASAF